MNAVDLLVEYPKKKGLEYETHGSSKRFYMFPNDPLLKSKYVYFKQEEVIFFAYDSYAAKMNMTNAFSGIYTSLDLDAGLEFDITKKDWLDIFTSSKLKTGVRYIDQNLTIKSNDKKTDVFQRFLTKENLLLFEKIFQQVKPLRLFARHNYLPQVKSLQNKLVLGLETNYWIYETSEIDTMMNQGYKLLNEIKRCSAFTV